MGKVTCCYKCTDRWVKDGKTCHSTCDKYLKQKKKSEEENAALRERKKIDNFLFKNSR